MKRAAGLLVVSAVVRRGDRVLMVRNSTPAFTSWSLPGGMVDAGELLTDALVREVREETGLEVTAVKRLVIVTQHYHPQFADALLAFSFETEVAEGDLVPDDPDGLISECGFFTVDEAAELIRGHDTIAPMSTPLIDYLRGEAAPGTSWFWRRTDGPDDPPDIVV